LEIRSKGGGETLAVLALLVPLVAAGFSLAFRLASPGTELALAYGAVFVTAVLLTIDAALLGSIDMKGTQRASAGALFLGMIFLWVVFYPSVFFRRRLFGRSNFGPLAILVALLFFVAPFAQNLFLFGIVAGGETPTCTSREVIGMVNDIIRQSDVGGSVLSITEHREIRYDESIHTRLGQCLLKTKDETMLVGFKVQLVDPKRGTFQIFVDPILTTAPPSCTNPDVVALVERLVRQGPNGFQVASISDHREKRYDQETKTRHGRCTVVLPGQTIEVAYKVFWIDPKTGQFQVQLEP
jgi:hypothetical protein